MNYRMKLAMALLLLILLISPIAAAAPDRDYQILRLDSICDGYWRVRNFNQYDVAFTWAMDGTGYSGSGIARANGDVFFDSPTCSETGAPQTVRIYANGFENYYDINNCESCSIPITTSVTQSAGHIILKLSSICDGYWRVRNYNPYDVAFTWAMDGTGYSGSGIARANGDVFFDSPTCSETGAPQTVRIYAGDFENDHESGGCQPCPTTTTTTTTTIITTPFFDYQILRLDNMTDGYWRVRNYNTYDVAFTWVMDGNGQAGYGNVHAISDAYFNTPTCSETGAPQTVRIFANGFENFHETAICENYNVTITASITTAMTTSVPTETITPGPGDLSIYVEDNTIYIGQTVNVNVNDKGEKVTNAAIYLNDVLIDFTDDSGELEFIMPDTGEGLVPLRAVKGTSSDTILVLVIGDMINGQTTSSTTETHTTTTSPGLIIPVIMVTIYILTAWLRGAKKRRRLT